MKLNDFLLIFPFFVMWLFTALGATSLVINIFASLITDKRLDILDAIVCLGFAAVIAAMLYDKKAK